MEQALAAQPTPVEEKKVLVIFKVALAEWLAGGEMDGTPLVPIKREGLTSEDTAKALDILEQLKVEIDAEGTSDWVELKRTVDDRISILHPGSYIVVWTNGTASYLDEVKGVAYDGDSVSVAF